MKPLVRKPGETMSHFRKREHCDQMCSNQHTADKSQAKGKCRPSPKKAKRKPKISHVFAPLSCDNLPMEVGRLYRERMYRGALK